MSGDIDYQTYPNSVTIYYDDSQNEENENILLETAITMNQELTAMLPFVELDSEEETFTFHNLNLDVYQVLIHVKLKK